MIARSRRGWLPVLACVALALIWVAVLAMPHMVGRSGITDGVEYRLVDLRHRLVGPLSPAPDLRIVAIDDATLSDASVSGQSRRILLARLIDNIAASGARSVFVDVLLADAGNAAEDKALARALAALPSVIAGAARFGTDGGTDAALIWPQEVFAAAAEVGLVNLSTDAAGTPRYAPMLVTLGQGALPSAVLLAALSTGDQEAALEPGRLTVDGHVIPLDHGLNLPIRYLGASGAVPTISASTLLEGPDPDALAETRVVLGFSAAATGDRFATPFDDSMPGMEVIATAISQIAGGPALQRDGMTRTIDVGHAAALTLLCLLLLTVFPLPVGAVGVLISVGVSFAGTTFLFAAGVWLSAALPLAAALPPAVVVGMLRYRQERQQANRTEETVASLRRFQSPALARRIENDPEYLATPQEQVLVVFFVDLTGFTGLSQALGPEGTRNLLQKFHRLCAQSIESRGGSVFNYMGDGVMAVFGLDDDPELAAGASIRASFDLIGALSATRLEEAPEVVLRCRIGVHRGLVTLSRLGGDSHQQVTITGDTVNFASRLMEVAKSEAAVIAASRALCEALKTREQTQTARQVDVDIRGRAGREQVFVWSQDSVSSPQKS
ncbi:MAG: adenylate/guanylate cyclase domain-containing protein [Pseudomonadota bacterium]